MKILFLPFLVLVSGALSAQDAHLVTPEPPKEWSADVSMWGALDSNRNMSPSFWSVVNYDNFHFEVRNNFDMSDGVSYYFGYQIVRAKLGSTKLTFTPAVGFVRYGERSNFGLTSHTVIEARKWKLYSVNQHLLAMSEWTGNITYDFLDAGYYAGPLVLGASAQRYETGHFMNLDIGPSIGFEANKGASCFYARVYAWDFWERADRYYGVWIGMYLSNKK